MKRAKCPPNKTQYISLVTLSLLITIALVIIKNNEIDSNMHIALSPSFQLETLGEPDDFLEEVDNPTLITVQQGQVLSEIFFEQGIPNSILYAMLNKIPKQDQDKLSNLKPGQHIEFIYNEQKDLVKMILDTSATENLIVSFDQGQYTTQTETLSLTHTNHRVSFEIESSLYQSAIEHDVMPALVQQITDLFGQDIDLSKDLRIGDRFDIIYATSSTPNGDIQKSQLKDVIYFSQAKRREYRATYLDNLGFFSPTGDSFGKALIEKPLNYTHISSHFNLDRMHPILKIRRPHRGVDFAAKEGTPIWSIGEGKVTFIGNRSGYGRTIMIQHDNQHKTLYAHLSAYAKDLKVGKTVKAKEVIGFVGQSGLATAPHLHFEFHVNNIAIDPLKRPDPVAKTLTGEDLINLQVEQEQWDLLRDQEANRSDA